MCVYVACWFFVLFCFTGAVWCVGFCTGKRHDGLLQEVFDVLGFRRCLTFFSVFFAGV